MSQHFSLMTDAQIAAELQRRSAAAAELDQDQQSRIVELWEKGCPVDILCDIVDIEPEIIEEFLRGIGYCV